MHRFGAAEMLCDNRKAYRHGSSMHILLFAGEPTDDVCAATCRKAAIEYMEITDEKAAHPGTN